MTTFQKQVAVPVEREDENEEEEYEDDEEEEIAAAPAPPSDPIAELLAEIGASSASYAIVVSRLANFERDQRTDPRSRTYCGALSVPDADYLAEERYKEDIQLKWSRPGKANYFQCQIKKNGKNLVFLPNVIAIEPLTPRELAEKEHAPAAPAPFMYASENTSGGELKGFIKMAKELQGVGLFPNFAEMRATAPQSLPAATEMTDELAMLRIIKADDETRKKLFEGVRGLMNGGEKQTGLVDIVMLALQNGPEIVKAISEIWQQSNPSPLNGTQAPAMMQAPPPAPAPPVVLTPVQELFNFVLSALERRAPVQMVASVIGQKADADREINQMVEAFLSASAQECLDWIVKEVPQAEHIANAPEAASWIDGLQRELKTEEVIN